MLVDIGLKFYSIPLRPTWVTLRSRSQTLKFCVDVFGYTLHIDRYWFEGLCCTIMTHLTDLEVKVLDLEILC